MRQRILPVLGLLFIASQGFAADSPPTVSDIGTAGGLACFTVTLAQATSADTPNTKNCNELCAAHSAACTGVSVGAINPPTIYADSLNSFAACRCCVSSK